MMANSLEGINFLQEYNIACNLQFFAACNLKYSDHKLFVFAFYFLCFAEKASEWVFYCRIRLIAQGGLR